MMTTDDLPKFIEFNGRKYQLEPRKLYYTRQNWSAAGPSSLHRAIWEHHYGPIPDYHDIHHKDENPLNNDISNLECIDRGKHHSDHMQARIASGNPPVLSEAARVAVAAWQREHGSARMAAIPRHEAICVECGQLFLTLHPKRAKFCHPNCKQMDLRRRHGMLKGARPNRKRNFLPQPKGFPPSTKF